MGKQQYIVIKFEVEMRQILPALLIFAVSFLRVALNWSAGSSLR